MNFLVSWKTSVTGVLAIVLGVLALFGISVPGMQPMLPEAALGMIVAGLGLLAAKDHNVTGGTKQQ